MKSPKDRLSKQKGDEQVQDEVVKMIPLSSLHSFPCHPFKILDDESMQQTVDSVTQYGVLTPAIVRPREEGGFEIISGHRRKRAAELAGLKSLPALIRPMDDASAVILMVDSNLQRENILPSERAFAYQMKLYALKHQGQRTASTSCQIGTKLRSDEQLAESVGESARTVQRYIRLTHLIPKLLDLVDQKKIAFNPAVELSYLSKAEQQTFLDALETSQNSPSLSQAQRIKKLSQDGHFTPEAIERIMLEVKKPVKEPITEPIPTANIKAPVPEVKPQIKQSIKPEAKQVSKPKIKSDVKSEVKPESKPLANAEVPPEIQPTAKQEINPENSTQVTLTNDVLRKYFPRSYTPKQMQDTIIKLLEQWQRKRQRDQSR
jgi:ParB family chromosome partitioning protein